MCHFVLYFDFDSKGDVLGNGASSKPVPQSSHGDSEETPTILAQPAVSNAESEVGFGKWKFFNLILHLKGVSNSNQYS